jgi:hypothetical protein
MNARLADDKFKEIQSNLSYQNSHTILEFPGGTAESHKANEYGQYER